MMRMIRIFLGLTFLALGLAGLVLPFLQGWLFLSLAVLTLSIDIPLFARFICWIENRCPWIQRMLHRMKNLLSKRNKVFPPCPPEK